MPEIGIQGLGHLYEIPIPDTHLPAFQISVTYKHFETDMWKKQVWSLLSLGQFVQLKQGKTLIVI